MVRPLDVVAALTQVSRDFATPQDLETTLQTLVTVARDSTPEVDHVSISVRMPQEPMRTVAATDDVVHELGSLQSEIGEGPCLHVMDEEVLVRVDRLPDERRWPRFVARAAELGVRSYAGVRFHADQGTVGVLSMYSDSTDVVSDETVQMADLFAAHAGLATGHARRIENLNAALRSRTVIGLALGMIMQRLDLDEKTAFSYLTRISATTETKLRDVAAMMVQQHHESLSARPGGPDTAPSS